MIRGGVVVQVGGEEDVGASLSRGRQQRVPGPAGDGHRLDGGVRVPADEEAGRGIGQGDGDGGGEIAQRTSELAVVSLGGVVKKSSFRVAGDRFDTAIVDYVR